MQPFRFGVQAAPAPDVAAWRKRVSDFESMGYSTVFLPDHLDAQWAPVVGLAVAAEATERLRVGSLVLSNDYRHPLVLAKELSSLDLVSEGRLEVGLGAGWLRSDYEMAGIAYDPASVRISRLAEAAAILRGLWSKPDTPLDFEGEHYRISKALCEPRPFRPGGPPLTIGGGGERILSLAAAVADVVGVNPSLASGAVDDAAIASALPERFDQRLSWVRRAAGERMGELEIQCLTFMVEVGRGARQRLEAIAGHFGLAAEVASEIPVVAFGEVEELCELLFRRRERWGFNYWVVHDHEAEAFAPVVERLAGN